MLLVEVVCDHGIVHRPINDVLKVFAIVAAHAQSHFVNKCLGAFGLHGYWPCQAPAERQQIGLHVDAALIVVDV